VEPVLRQLLVLVLEADLADVEDVQLHRVQAGHAELRHRGSEVLLALLEGDVQGLRSGLHVLVEHGEGEGGLHRARRAGDGIDGNEYLYFWHYEREGGRSERREDYVGPVREAKSRQEAARKLLAFHRRVQQDLGAHIARLERTT